MQMMAEMERDEDDPAYKKTKNELDQFDLMAGAEGAEEEEEDER